MATKKTKKQDGRSIDENFGWMLTTLGPEWEEWQKLAAEWMATQHEGLSHKFTALSSFFERYLLECAPYAVDMGLFFKGYKGHRCSTEELEAIIRKTVKSPTGVVTCVNVPFDFIDFVIKNYGSEKDDYGNLIPILQNPLHKTKKRGMLTETVRNPLPYRYIQDLRQILCPLPDKHELSVIEQNLRVGEDMLPAYHYRHFSDWTWAHRPN